MSGGKHSLIQVKFEIYKNVTSKRTVQKQLNVELSISNNPFWASQGCDKKDTKIGARLNKFASHAFPPRCSISFIAVVSNTF